MTSCALSRRAVLRYAGSGLAASAPPWCASAQAPAPGFDLPVWDLTSQAPHTQQRLSLDILRGRWVYLDFWASWCGPCRQSFPWMNEFSQSMAPHHLAVVAIGLDTRAEPMARFLAQHKPRFVVLWDAQQTTPAPYQVQAMPSSYLIAPQGRIAWTHRGFAPSDAAGIEASVRQKMGLA